MISVAKIEGNWCPVLVCDVCRTYIKTGQEGVAVYPMHDDEYRMTQAVSVHKFEQPSGNCFEIAMALAQDEGALVGWQPLGSYVETLSHNLAVKESA